MPHHPASIKTFFVFGGLLASLGGKVSRQERPMSGKAALSPGLDSCAQGPPCSRVLLPSSNVEALPGEQSQNLARFCGQRMDLASNKDQTCLLIAEKTKQPAILTQTRAYFSLMKNRLGVRAV